MANERIKAGKKLNTRISLKMDTWDNWNSTTGKAVVLLKGEVAFVQVGEVPPTPSAEDTHNGLLNVSPNSVLFKVGDGTTPFKDLVWGGAVAADVYDWAKAKTVSFNTKNNKIEFKDASGTVIGNGVDLSTFVTTTTFSEFETEVNTFMNTTVPNTYATTNSVNTAIAGLKKTSTTAKDTDETIAGAKAYADKKIDDLLKAYILDEENGGTSDAIDKLQEVAAWITNDSTGAAKIASDLNSHLTANGANDNPHNITAAKIGVYTTTEANNKFATKDALTGGTITVKNATNATNATNAINAENATKATQDGSGNNIVNTYATKQALQEHASTHAPSNAQPNQNAISTVKVLQSNGTARGTFSSDSPTDTLQLKEGSNVTLALSGDTVTISADNMRYTHPTQSNAPTTSGFYKIVTDDCGHIKNAEVVTSADISALGVAITDTTYSVATNTKAGLIKSGGANGATGDITVASTGYVTVNSATKATKDGAGNVIADTYVDKLTHTNLDSRVGDIEKDYLKVADYFWIDCGSATTNID